MDLKKVAVAVGLLVIAGIVAWAAVARLGGGEATTADGSSSGATTDESSSGATTDGSSSGATTDDAMVFTGTTLDGEPFDLEDYRGKPVVVNFWASWCGYCGAEMPDLLQFAADHPDVAVVGVAVNDDEEAAREAAASWGLTFPSVLDPDGAIFAEFDGQGLPTTVFFDKDLVPRETAIGQTDLAGFEAGLQKAQ